MEGQTATDFVVARANKGAREDKERVFRAAETGQTAQKGQRRTRRENKVARTRTRRANFGAEQEMSNGEGTQLDKFRQENFLLDISKG